jgi:hypothetical protein
MTLHKWTEYGGPYFSQGEPTDNIQSVCSECGVHEDDGNKHGICYGSPYAQLRHYAVEVMNAYIPAEFMNQQDVENMKQALDELHNTLIDLEGYNYSLKEVL